MTRTITVKGIGSVSVKPDQVVLTLSLESKDLDYNEAMSVASKQIGQLHQAIEMVGFDKESLKTSNFNVRTSYERVKDKGDNYKDVFDGYIVEHDLKLAFDLEAQRLSEVLSAISACHARPDINIAFTVKNPSGVHELLLQDAARNAMKKADALIGALGVQLGQLLTVDYNWSEINVFSQTRYVKGMFICNELTRSYDANITPEDIDISDTATFVWEIQ